VPPAAAERGGSGAVRALGHPVAILCLYLALAAVYAAPVLRWSHVRIANDPYDPVLNASILWWNATTLPFSPSWWSPPYFYPSTGVSAFTENLMGISILATPVYWATGNPLTAYNIALFLTWPLCAFGAYLLALQVSGRRDAALLAGLVYGFNPYRTAELAHLQMIASYGMPVAILGLHRFGDERRGRWLGVFAAAWIVQSLANGYFILFGGVFIAAWLAYFCSTRDTWRAMPAIAAAWGASSVLLVPILFMYHRIHEQYGLRRSMEEALAFSAPPSAWFETSPYVWLWSHVLSPSKDNLFPGVTAVLVVVIGFTIHCLTPPGPAASVHDSLPDTHILRAHRRRALLVVLTAIGLACLAAVLAALAVGPWRVELGGLTVRVTTLERPLLIGLACGGAILALSRRARTAIARRSAAVFYVAATLGCAILCFGPALKARGAILLEPMPYGWLMAIPGFDQLRVPTRFWMLGVMALGVAAAIAFARVGPRRPVPRAIVFALLALGIMADSWTRGIGMAIPPDRWPRVERRDRTEPILELPLGPEWDAAATFRSMWHRRPVLNGVSGYDPPHYEPLKYGLSTHDPEMLLAIASLRPFDVVVNSAADPGGRLDRYVAGLPGAVALANDGVRTAYGIPAAASIEGAVGLALPIVGARANAQDAAPAVDGQVETEWHDGRTQQVGQWLIADLGEPRDVAGVTHALGEYARDFPRRLAVDVSLDGVQWQTVWEKPTAALAFLAAVRGPREAAMRMTFEPHRARYVRLRQTGRDEHLWRVAELEVHAPR
jgi:hypothetical protein